MNPDGGPILILLLIFAGYFVDGEYIRSDQEMFIRKEKPPDGLGSFLQRKSSHTEKRIENTKSRSKIFQIQNNFIAEALSGSSVTDAANLEKERKALLSKDQRHRYSRKESDATVNDKISSRDRSLKGNRMNEANLRSAGARNNIGRQQQEKILEHNRRLRMAVQRSDAVQSERRHEHGSQSVSNSLRSGLRSRTFVDRSLRTPIRLNTNSLLMGEGSSNRRSESFRGRLNIDRRIRQEQRARSVPEQLNTDRRIRKLVRNNVETRENAELKQSFQPAELLARNWQITDRRSRPSSLPSKRRTEPLHRYEGTVRNSRSTARSLPAEIKQKELMRSNHEEQSRAESTRKFFRADRRLEPNRREHNRWSSERRSDHFQRLVNHRASENLVQNRYKIQNPSALTRSYLTTKRELVNSQNRIRREKSLFRSSLLVGRFQTWQPSPLNTRSMQNRLSAERRFDRSELKTRSNQNNFAAVQKSLVFSQINAKSQSRAELRQNNAVNRNRQLARSLKLEDQNSDTIQNRWDAQREKRSIRKISVEPLVRIRSTVSQRRLKVDQILKSERVQTRASVHRFEQHNRLASESVERLAVGYRAVRSLQSESSSNRVLRLAMKRRSEQVRELVSECRPVLGRISKTNLRSEAMQRPRSKSLRSVASSKHRPEMRQRKLSGSVQSLAQEQRWEEFWRSGLKPMPYLASKQRSDRIYRKASESVQRLANRSKSDLAQVLPAIQDTARIIRIRRSTKRRMEQFKTGIANYRQTETHQNRQTTEQRSKPTLNTFTMDEKIKLVQEGKKLNRRVEIVPISLNKILPVALTHASVKQAKSSQYPKSIVNQSMRRNAYREARLLENKINRHRVNVIGQKHSRETKFYHNTVISLGEKTYFALKSEEGTLGLDQEQSVGQQWDPILKKRQVELEQYSIEDSKSEPIYQNKNLLEKQDRKDQPALDTSTAEKRNGRGYRGRDNAPNRFLKRVKRQSKKQIELVAPSNITDGKQRLDSSEKRNFFNVDQAKGTLNGRNQVYDMRIQMATKKQKPADHERLDSEGYFNVQLGNIASLMVNCFLGFHILAAASSENGGGKTKNLFGKLKNAFLLKIAPL